MKMLLFVNHLGLIIKIKPQFFFNLKYNIFTSEPRLTTYEYGYITIQFDCWVLLLCDLGTNICIPRLNTHKYTNSLLI